jgi:hypothetical protein
MRVVYSPAAGDRGKELIRQVGYCRACGARNIVWMCRGHMVTRAMLKCEHCGSHEGQKKKAANARGIAWKTELNTGKVVARNFPERAKPGDLVM